MNPISGIVGQMIAYLICDRIGRRWTAIASCLIAIPGMCRMDRIKIYFIKIT